MTQPTPEEIEAKLDRISEADEEETPALLESAHADLNELREHLDTDVDEATVERLEAELERHEEVFEDHDEYGGSLGAAMNPDEEDAT